MTTLTPQEQEVRERIRWDTVAFATNFVNIVNKRGQQQKLIPKPEQVRFDDALLDQDERGLPMRAIVLKARQLGFSTWTQAKLIQRVTQNPFQRALVLAQEHGTAGELFEIGRRMYEGLPDYADLRPKVVGRRKMRLLEFENHSWYRADSAKEFESGRGLTLHGLHISELAFYPDAQRKLTGLLQAVPPEPGTLIVLESTANGQNYFKELWDSAVSGESDYLPFFSAWFDEPSYRRAFANEAERQEFEASVGDGEFGDDEPALMDLGVTLEQLAWRRWVIRNQLGGDLDRFRQEFPSCLTAETRVSTERGIIRISEAEGCKRTESGPIERWGVQAASPIFKLTTKGGRVLRGTADHPVQTDGGLVWLSNLQPGQQLELRPPCFATSPYCETWRAPMGVELSLPVTADLARFMGFFMGDGSWHADTLSMACDAKDPDVTEEVRRLVDHYVGLSYAREIDRVQGRRGCTELRVGRKSAREPFARLGLIHRVGDAAWRRNVCVPESIWRSPKPIVREFLRGLFEADGSASANRVRWASYRLDFARDVQLLLLGFGINAPITENRKQSGNGGNYTSFVLDLTVADSRRFHDEIGFVGARKRGLRPPEQACGRPSSPRAFVDEVLSVEPDGFEETWDFALATNDHLFQAHGIVTHNTPIEAFITSGRTVFKVGLIRGAERAAAEKAPVAVGRLEATAFNRKPDRSGQLIDVPAGVKFTETSSIHDDRAPGWLVWEHPKPATDDEPPGQYVIAADVSGGEERNGARAYHVIEVIDHRTRVQVAEYRSRIDPDTLAQEIFLACLYYNRPWAAPEVTGGWGGPVARRLKFDYKYPFVYQRPKLDSSMKTEERLGWDTNWVTKRHMEDVLNEVLRMSLTNELHVVRSKGLAQELGWYVRDQRNRSGPEPGKWSDRVMAFGIAQAVAQEKPLRPQRKRGEVHSTLDNAQITRRYATLG